MIRTTAYFLLVCITQCLSNWIQEIVKRGISSESPYVHLEIQCHIPASIIKRADGSTDLI